MMKDTPSGTQSLRHEAAHWFALMRGPDAQARRSEFEEWLAADERHRDAYNRIGETFSLGKGLKTKPEFAHDLHAASVTATAPVGAPHARAVGGLLVMATVLALAVVGATTLALGLVDRDNPLVAGIVGTPGDNLATSRGEIRTFALSDGSIVTLDTDSRVAVKLTATRRALALLRGRARFTVAHEPRPFVVAAAGGWVLAHGTVFDVALSPDQGAVVNLIEGVVDVGAPGKEPGRGRGEQVTRLTAGRALAFGRGGAGRDVVPAFRADWTSDLRDLKAVRLGDLVAEANRYSGVPLVLASSDLAGLEVSGSFGIRDTQRLASNLGDLLDLAVHERDGAIVLSRRCEATAVKNCLPP